MSGQRSGSQPDQPDQSDQPDQRDQPDQPPDDPRQAVWEARRRDLEERVRQVNRWCSARGGKIPTGEGPFSRWMP